MRFKGGVDLRTVKTNYYVAIDINNWNSSLTGFFDGFQAGGRVFVDINVFVFDVELIEVAHSRMAKTTPLGSVNYNLLVITHTSSLALYFLK
jgi:hypothetical protein